ncbi:alpha-ketoglutarate-dependent dioxygenase AlkB [Maribacter sp. PR1]|uniref:Alpha-ketoglutarate-dependent dioxygenase AlkB n=1 Tax=Maribacter cobaltidurans TaxID=1178778 RepID=A0ABU7IWZ7_9FLAO|nr:MULTISPECIES: alpha-ketoglutarate-dependent dioxygenase AlkB [Maribacter]MDC6390063.1 alpha-ketoglutarate-dependent dioxygenase AlkB [Maribacter sp. PR1]MEE1977453.1 alpha-ketoglutarate-dependent dioxygenase AlkB [Maribacter cobaltidurans]
MSKNEKKGQHLALPDCDIIYYPHFLEEQVADSYFKLLRSETPWQQDDIKVFGKVYPQPRLTALYANNSKPYSYSNITMKPQRFTKSLLELKSKIEYYHSYNFTTCLLNLYRDGKDSNGWHADDEKELGRHPIIASLSLGAERMFHLKHNIKPHLKHKMALEHGSLLLMQGETQHMWKHQIPKTAKQVGERINLTFRII